jgi:hypothetical protein
LHAGASANDYGSHIERAVEWALAERPYTLPRKSQVAHDSSLVGWTWAAGTHSWLEPTALFVLALKAAGHAQHPRTREGVRLLIDRLLPNGGCNYGNTIVLGQTLLPHILPTGLAMLALAGEQSDDARLSRSLAYLNGELSAKTATASLCYGLMGLAEHGIPTPSGEAWLHESYLRTVASGASSYKLALVALAAANRNPMTASFKVHPSDTNAS